MRRLDEAKGWLVALFQDGVVEASEVLCLAESQGFAKRTVERAAKELGVVKRKVGGPGEDRQCWVWSLAAFEGDVAVSGPEPVEILSGLRLEDGSTWGESATELQWSDALAVLARDPQVRRFWIGRTRGYSKTTDTAGFTIAAALGGLIPPGEKGFCVAADRDQAALVSEAVEGFVRRTPELHGVVVVERNAIKFPTVGVTVEVMSSDAPSAWGRRGWWWTVDEISSWSDTPNSHDFYDAVSTSWPKVPGCRVVVISTAGSPSHFSRKLYETAADSPEWRLSDDHGVAPWIDPATIEGERARLSDGTFGRLWENRWTQAEDHLVTEANLRRCVTLGDWPIEPGRGRRYVLGVDLATKFDSSAVCVAHDERRDGERRVVVDDMEVFTPRRGWDVSLAEVERRVEQLAGRYRPAVVSFDPANASLMVENLRARGLRVEEFKFTAASNDKMTNLLHTMLRDGLIDLPDDEALLDELLSVRVVETRQGGLKVDTVPGKHDDQVDALGICAVTLMERPAHRGGSGVSAAGHNLLY